MDGRFWLPCVSCKPSRGTTISQNLLEVPMDIEVLHVKIQLCELNVIQESQILLKKRAVEYLKGQTNKDKKDRKIR